METFVGTPAPRVGVVRLNTGDLEGNMSQFGDSKCRHCQTIAGVVQPRAFSPTRFSIFMSQLLVLQYLAVFRVSFLAMLVALHFTPVSQ